MKKIFTILFAALCCVSVSAQLAWNHELVKADFNNAQTKISQSENVKWNDGVFGIGGGGFALGKTVTAIFNPDPYNDEVVIALPRTGIADTLRFTWSANANASMTVSQSVDHTNWTAVWAGDGVSGLLGAATSGDVEVPLSANARYLRFAATGKSAATFKSIIVSELTALAAGTDEWPFAAAKVDDAPATKTVNISWTNIVANVSSTDPHFAVSLETIGQKAQAGAEAQATNKTTALTISYLHTEAGSHTGDIVIAGEGREVRIAVSGSTTKYDQTLAWNQDINACVATDDVTFTAFTNSGLDVAYVSSDSSLAYVEDAKLVIRKAGTVTITATQPGNYKFNAATPVSKEIVISKAEPEVALSVGDLTYGQALSEVVFTDALQAVPGAFSWVNADPADVLNAGTYDMQVLFTPTNLDIYNTKTLPVSLTVNKAQQTILWEDQTTELRVDESVALTATLSSGLPLTYAFTSCGVTINENTLTANEEGQLMLIAFHLGNDNYLPTTIVMKDFVVLPAQVATRLEQLTPDQVRSAQKFYHNGQVIVYFEGRTYDVEGRLMK